MALTPVREDGALFKRNLFGIVPLASAFPMKKPLLLLTAAVLMAHPIFAQEKATAPEKVTAPDNQRLELMPSDVGHLPVAPPLPLIPEPARLPEPPKERRSEEPEKSKRSKTEIAGDDMQERIKFRELKIRAEKDPAVVAEWERAHLTKTDYERRAALTSYFKLLYGRMQKLNSDKKVGKLITVEQGRSIHRLEQTRVAPTEPFKSAER